MFFGVAGIAKHFKVFNGVVRSVSVAMMNYQTFFRRASIAFIDIHKSAIISLQPFRFRDKISIAFFRDVDCLHFVSALERTGDRRFGKNSMADGARSATSAASPIRIVFPEVLNSWFSFSQRGHRSMPAGILAIFSTPISGTRWSYEESFLAIETNHFDFPKIRKFWHGVCIVTCTGYLCR